MKQLTKSIKQEAKKIGFDLVGIARAEPLTKIYNILKYRKKNNDLPAFMTEDIKKATNPKMHLQSAESIISLAISYASSERINGEYNISIYAQGNDYHQIMKNKLNQLKSFISSRVNAKMISYVDTGSLMERAFARKAGLGWIGKNTNLINSKYGSYLFLGEIITNLTLEYDKQVSNKCGSCQLCINNCSGDALIHPYYLKSDKCIGYITQKKGIIPFAERIKIEDNLWGCDRCQQVCPFNENIPQNMHKEFKTNLSGYNLKDILDFSRKNPPSSWEKAALSWRGIRILKRNALIIIANKNLQKYKNEVIKNISDPSPIIRAYALWAFSKLEKEKAFDLLREKYFEEKNNMVRNEIKRIFNNNSRREL